MISIETLSLYIMICVLAPLIGAFTILFLFIFEKRLEVLETQANKFALERELQKSKYDILSQKIQPHFFFNTLNVILSLARLDRKADLIRSIETLAQFMKRKYKTNASLATIDEELTYTNYYLEIQKLRFGERLSVQMDIEPGISHILMPTYAIQTLDENCFKHSFENIEGNVQLKISVETDTENVKLQVWNSKGEKELTHKAISSDKNRGIGLGNIRSRLDL